MPHSENMKEKRKDTVLQDIKVTESAELLTFLIDSMVRKSRNSTKSLLVHRQIKVNNKIITQHNHLLQPGDKVTIHKHDPKLDKKKLKGLEIVYEDKELLVVDKEPGLLSVSTGREMKETAFGIVNNYIKSKNAKARAFVMFRLDRETSGLMVYVKSEELQQELQDEWTIRPPKRIFTAIVEGRMKEKKGTITSWLTENKNFKMFVSETDNGGLKAVTHYEVIQANSKYTLISLTPDTFRKNQLRVQFESIGHPILGDKKYGSKANPLKRISLHADKLIFTHPTTKEKIELELALPKKMQILADSILAKKDE